MTLAADESWRGTVAALGEMPPTPDQAIGRGESAEVFRLDERYALKLFFEGVPRSTAALEFAALQVAGHCARGAPNAVAIVTVGVRHGVVMDFIAGRNVLPTVARSPIGMTLALVFLARYQARMHRHGIAGADLPTTHDVLRRRLGSSDVEAVTIARAARTLDALPGGDRLCHGDLHLGNVMRTTAGYAAIDWSKATIGDPIADVARSELLLRYGKYGRTMVRFPPVRIMRHFAANWYLFWYFCFARSGMTRYYRWRLPVAIAWLQPRSTAYAPSLRRAIRRML